MAVWLSLSVSQGTPNATARTNTVTASVTVHYSGGSYNGNSPSGTLTIDGQSFNFTCNFNYAGIGQGAVTTGTGSVGAASQTVTVSYGSSTTRTVYVSASFASGTASGTVTASDSISLTPISSGGSSGGGDDGGEEWEDPDNPGSGGSDSGDIVVTPGNCTVIGQDIIDSEKDRLDYSLEEELTVGFYTIWKFITVVNFTTPKFDGVSQSLTVNLYSTSVNFTSVYDTICFALCRSDFNHGGYFGSTSVVTDPNQITRGSLSQAEWTSMPFTIQTSELESETAYYLIFWVPSDNGYASAGKAQYHSITVNYTDSDDSDNTVRIDASGTGFGTYTILIDTNGTGFEEYEAWIDNGTAFEPYY